VLSRNGTTPRPSDEILTLRSRARRWMLAGVITAVLSGATLVMIHAVPGLLLCIPMLVFFRWSRVAARQAQDLFYNHRDAVCLSCGYDCQQLDIKQHPMCPECGSVRGAYFDPAVVQSNRPEHPA
jgi:hypothetical protein